MKRFIGTSENRVRIQIIIAMIAYLLLRMASKTMQTKKSLQQFARRVSANLMQRRKFTELLVDSSPSSKKTKLKSAANAFEPYLTGQYESYYCKLSL